jgi:CCR4-NOT transcription complex subunit 7/8
MAAGIDFADLAKKGIESSVLAEHLIVSGLVLNPDVNWIAFHSGYDFAYFLRLLSAYPLPKSQAGFLELIQLYFPNIYDLKYLMRYDSVIHFRAI